MGLYSELAVFYVYEPPHFCYELDAPCLIISSSPVYPMGGAYEDDPPAPEFHPAKLLVFDISDEPNPDILLPNYEGAG